MNSRAKGARGERQWRDELRANGYEARRGQQFSGSPDSPDVVCAALPWVHFEVKAVERLNIEEAMEQARRDCGGKVPLLAHKRNHRPWLVTMGTETFFELLREFQPRMHTDAHGLGGEKVGRWEREKRSGDLSTDAVERVPTGGPEDYLGQGTGCGQ